MKTPLGGAFDGSHDGADDHDGGKTGKHMLGPMQVLDAPMRHYGLDEEVDFAIVGVGAAGGVLAQRLARAGFRV
ncbi:MAG TPA: hypothetical protein VIG30_17925, partial [Ktedonobacterales bacterium]